MDKYKIKYIFSFDGLEMELPCSFLLKKSIVTYKKDFKGTEIVFTLYNPKPTEPIDEDSHIHIVKDKGHEGGPLSMKGEDFDLKSAIGFIEINKWEQELDITFELEKEKNFCFEVESEILNFINEDITANLNNWLSILQDNFFKSNWLSLPKFVFKKNDQRPIQDENNISHINFTCYKNEEKVVGPCGIFSVKCNVIVRDIKSSLTTFDETLNKAIKDFLDNIEDKKHEIYTPRELLLLADYERKINRYKLALLLMAMAVEISAKLVIEIYGEQIHKYFLSKKVEISIFNLIKDVMPDIISNNDFNSLDKLNVKLDLLEQLFMIRNKIAHEGKTYYQKNEKKRFIENESEILDYFKFSQDFVDNKIPKIIDLINDNRKDAETSSA